MDIGIGHVITANGVVINAFWDTFNPNLALGEKHEIAIFEEDIELKDIYSKIDDCLVRLWEVSNAIDLVLGNLVRIHILPKINIARIW